MNRLGKGVLVASLLGAGSTLSAQMPGRAIRRTIPITRTFEHGLAAGTRDSSGRPGPRYWQLGVDYRIGARLDPALGRISGHASITVHNTSPVALATVPIRLYQNRFTAIGVRVRHPPSVTRGIRLTRIIANRGEVDSLDRLEPSWAMPPLVRVKLATPIAPGGTGTLEVEWISEVPDVPEGRRGASRRSFVAELKFGKARIERITLDPHLRFPDRRLADNTWPRAASQ